MPKLIDADKLTKELKRDSKRLNFRVREWANTMIHLISVAPTVEAEPVVRCKDCRYGVDYYHEGDCYCSNPKWGLRYFGGSWKFYCADAERREDAIND